MMPNKSFAHRHKSYTWPQCVKIVTQPNCFDSICAALNRTRKFEHSTTALSLTHIQPYGEILWVLNGRQNACHGRYEALPEGVRINAVFICKKNGTLCFCVEYWKLNVVRIWKMCQIRYMNKYIFLLRNETIFSTLDTNCENWHIGTIETYRDLSVVQVTSKLSPFRTHLTWVLVVPSWFKSIAGFA